jgi:hypothetical protein
MGSRLSIEIGDRDVSFHGLMSLKEASDFMKLFEKYGFDGIRWGEDNSCLHLIKLEKSCSKDDEKYHPNLLGDFPENENPMSMAEKFIKIENERDQFERKISELQHIITLLCGALDAKPLYDSNGGICGVKLEHD